MSGGKPEGVPKEIAAIASDAGITAYNAVKNAAGVSYDLSILLCELTYCIQLGQGGHGKKVLIFGIGGLGHLAVQYAKYFGAEGMQIQSLFRVEEV